MLVGVTGRAQHGKDSVAARLVNHWGYTRLGFADALKDMALLLNPVIGDLGSALRLQTAVEDLGWEQAKMYPEARRFLQVLGTEACRGTFGDNVWVNALEQKVLDTHGPVVIADVRFPNEARWLHRHSGVLIRVTRPYFFSGVDPAHESEKHIGGLVADFEVLNDGDLTDLDRKVDSVMNDALEGFWGGNA